MAQATKGVSISSGILGNVEFLYQYDGGRKDQPQQAVDKDVLVMRNYAKQHNRFATYMKGGAPGDDAPTRYSFCVLAKKNIVHELTLPYRLAYAHAHYTYMRTYMHTCILSLGHTCTRHIHAYVHARLHSLVHSAHADAFM